MADSGHKWQFLTVMAVVFAITTAQLALRGKLTAPTTDFNEQMRMARYLLHGTGFVCPVGPERDDPSSWYTPGYIALMTAALAVFGEGSKASLAAVRLANAAAMSAAFALYFLIGLRKFGARAAWVALALMLLSPTLAVKAGEIWDTSLTMLAGACVFALFVLGRPKRPIAAVGAGLACGAAAMINPTFTLCYPVWVLHSWWHRPRGRRTLPSLLGYIGLVSAGFLVAILPWTIRNYRTFGELFYLRGNLPLELWSGNAPWSDGYGDSRGGNKPHPVFHQAEADRMVQLGEYGYFKACADDVAQWWKQDKPRFARLTARRIRWFWFGRYDLPLSRPARVAKMLGMAGATALAILGAAVVVWKKRQGLVLVATLLLFPVMYYVTQIMLRYRLPIEPAILLLAAVGLAGLWPKKPTAPRPS